MAVVSNAMLTDVPTLKSWLNISAGDTMQDANFERLIISVSETFKGLIRREPFILSTITEIYRGSGSSRLFLNAQPVSAIISVAENGKAIEASNPAFYNGSGWVFDKYGLVMYDRFDRYATYTVNYIGGFSLTSREASMAEQAVLSLCNLWWKRRVHADELARSLGQQITAKFTQDELPPETKIIVELLKRMT